MYTIHYIHYTTYTYSIIYPYNIFCAQLIPACSYPESEKALLDYAAMTSAISHYPRPPPFAHPLSSGSKRELFGDAVLGFGSAAGAAWPPPPPPQQP